ncbi:MAG: acireductone synthase [Pseudomonadota bacterium]
MQEKIHYILTDIEGTTSSINFVYETLFPYARKHLKSFVINNADEPEVRSIIAQACNEGKIEVSINHAIQLFEKWMDEDRKITPLKSIQGLIWQQGYEAGELKGHIYDDAAAELHNWHKKGLTLGVYSSGSVTAQKLIFGYSEQGNLAILFNHFFDTTFGGKLEKTSYEKIAHQINVSPNQICFLSDNPKELIAADQAGMFCILIQRDNLQLIANPGFIVAASFHDVDLLIAKD